MFFRILFTTISIGLSLTLCTTPLHADYKKATIRDTFVGKRCVDSEKEENGREPQESDLTDGTANLYAYARILAEHDDNEFLQSDGTAFKATGKIKGTAPNNSYNGFWNMDLDAWNKQKSYPDTGSEKWDGTVFKEKELKDKWKGDPKHLKPLIGHFYHCTATASITGGNDLQYHVDRGLFPPHQELAYAYAHDFQRSEADEWDETPGLSSLNSSYIKIDGEEMVNTAPGDSVSARLVMPSDKGYAKIHWYLAGPDDAGLGNELGNPTTSSWDDIEVELHHTFSMPSDASGVYTFTAYIYPHSNAEDHTVYTYSFKIYCS